MNNYGKFWRKARLSRGMSQKDLSLNIGLASPQFISNVERGTVRYSVTLLPKLVQTLNVDAEKVIRLILIEERNRLRRGLGCKQKHD
jgi:transcriptional regulator with XRE-family HTH domain